MKFKKKEFSTKSLSFRKQDEKQSVAIFFFKLHSEKHHKNRRKHFYFHSLTNFAEVSMFAEISNSILK